jgi:hypothetical protein
MSQLVPCPGCARHVRLSASTCPFCDVAIDVASLTEQYAPRRTVVTGGVKRAVMFALGAGVAAACGGEEQAQPIYGAPIATSSEATSSEPSPSTGSDSSDQSSDTTSGPLAQPLYGAPITEDLTSDVLAQPEYGAPLPPDAGYFSDEPTSDEGDGGLTEGDGGSTADAGVSSDELGLTSEPTVMPAYGIPPFVEPREK